MKKLMVVLAGVGILSMVGCDANNGESLNPAEVVQRYVAFLQQGKLREAAALIAEPGRQVMLADADAFDAHRQLIEAAKKQYGPSSQSSFDSFAINIGKGFKGDLSIISVDEQNDHAQVVAQLTNKDDSERNTINLVRVSGKWLVVHPQSGKEYADRHIQLARTTLKMIEEAIGDIKAERYRSARHAAKWIAGDLSSNRRPIVLLDGRAVYGEHIRHVNDCMRLFMRLFPLADAWRNLTPVAWFFLEEECDRSDMIIPAEEIDVALGNLLQAMGKDGLGETAKSRGLSPEELTSLLRDAIELQLRVHKLAFQHAGDPPDDDDLWSIYLDYHRTAKIQYVSLDALTLAHRVPAPTLEEVQQHFEKYADRVSGSGDSAYGYKLPAKFEVEYISVDYQELLSRMDVPEEDIMEYYQAHKGEGNPFDEARPQILEQLRRARTDELAFVTLDRLESLCRELMATADYDPADKTEERLKAEVASLGLPGVIYHRTSPMTAGGLYELSGIGAAFQPKAGSIRPFAEVIADFIIAAKPQKQGEGRSLINLLRYRPTDDDALSAESLPLAFQGIDGTRYLVTWVRTHPSRRQEMTKVIDKVREDIRGKRAFEPAENVADRLALAAKEHGLEAALKDMLSQEPDLTGVLGSLEKPEPFILKGLRAIPGSGGTLISEPLVETTFEILAQTPGTGHRVAAGADQGNSKCFVVEVLGSGGASKQDFAEKRHTIEAMAIWNYRREALIKWTDPEAILSRLKVHPVE